MKVFYVNNIKSQIVLKLINISSPPSGSQLHIFQLLLLDFTYIFLYDMGIFLSIDSSVTGITYALYTINEDF